MTDITNQGSAALPSEAMDGKCVECGSMGGTFGNSHGSKCSRATTPTAPDNMGPQGEDHPFNPTNDPDAPVQDDDAEWLRKKAKFARESRLSRSPSDAARFERIASRLSPTPETGL